MARTWLARITALLVLAAAAACQSPGPLSPAVGPPAFEYLGQQILPHAHRHADTTVGGLSGLDYDSATGRWWAISDDRSEFGPARYYELGLDLALFNRNAEPGHAGIEFRAVRTLGRLDGSTFASVRDDPARSVDPEAIRVHGPSGRLVWSSEGERIVRAGQPPVLVDPHVWEMQPDGRFLRAFVIPAKFRASASEHGIRRNLAFEGLSFTPDFATLFVMTENALLQDGPAATATQSSPSRLIALDYASGQPRAEYVIEVSPIPGRPAKPDGWADNGVPEILALDDRRLLVLERAYVEGIGNSIRLYLAELAGATDVSGLDTLAGARWTPATKRLLLDFGTLGARIDNIEGMSWGPLLPDGRRTLVFVSDDNFNPRQVTQFLAFAVRGL